jgi:hypothetical protein
MSAPDGAPEPSKLSRKKFVLSVVTILALIALAYSMVRLGAPQLGAPIIALIPVIVDLIAKREGRKRTKPFGFMRLFQRLLIPTGLGLMYLAGYLTPTVQTWITAPAVTLSFEHSGPVSRFETVTVHWRGFPDGESPELFVYAVELGLYFPQRCSMTAARAGEQSCKIEIGNDAENGESFDVVTSLVTQTASQEIARYFSDPTSAGLRALPGPGVVRIGATRVVRRTL